MNDAEFIIEFYQVGNAVKVTAIDPSTMTEVSIQGAVSTPQAQLERVAVQKLRYMLGKKKGGGA